MGKLLEIKTEHIGAIRSLFELLKDVFDDVNIECIRDDDMNKKLDDNKVNDDNNKNDKNDKNNDDIQPDSVVVKKKKKKSEYHDNNEVEEKDNKKDDDEKDRKSGGIKIVAMDRTQTLLVNVKLIAKKFDIFRVKKKIFDIGINLNQLYKSLKSLQKDDSLTISVNEDDKDWLMLKIKNEKKRYETFDKIKLMDINKSKYDIPPTAFDVVVTIDTEEFHTICKEMNHIQTVIEIKCTKKSLTFTSTGDSSERSKSYYPDENGIKINFSKDSKTDVVQGIFELKFLVMFSNKSQNLCPKIQLFMKNDYPLCVKFTVATLGKLLFCVSPFDEDRIVKDFDDDEEYYNENKVEYLEN
jgi:proliferating cell nuclear antigen